MGVGHITVVALLLLVSPACTRVDSVNARDDGAAARGRALHVLTYNIHHGEGTDGRIDLARIATLINSLNPDLVAVQEVDVRTRRSGGVDQAAELARLTGMHPYFARIIDYQGGPYGLLVLTRDEPVFTSSHELPYHPGEEPRRIAEVRVRVNSVSERERPLRGGKRPRDGAVEIAFFCTHLDYRDEAVRLRQVGRIEEVTAASDAPVVVLAGDFNAEPGSAPIRQILQSWRDAADRTPRPGQPPVGEGLTYPSGAPIKRIDYVFYRPSSRLRVTEQRVIDERSASDHRAVLAVFEVLGGD